MRFICTKLVELEKIKVGAVSYLNTKPLLFGIKRSGLVEKMNLVEDYPAKIAQLLLEGRIDIGLVPIAVLPKLNDYHFVTDFCIGTDGEVASVALFSDVELDKIDTVLMDYQSRTSVALLRILLKYYWKKEVQIVDTKDDFRQQINDTTAGLVIGDRAFEQRKKSKYIFDLGQVWKEMTGLPFVFAAWVANKPINEDFEDAFNRANAYGCKHLEEVLATTPYDLYDLHAYYTQNISYNFTADKKKGMELFLQLMTELD